MEFVTNEKLTIVGAAGMIGSNMAQTAIMMGLTPNICLYDPYAPGLEGVAEELFHCGFEGVNITFTSDIKEALTGAKYIVNSGGAARKAGMTREDLLKGNAAIAEMAELWVKTLEKALMDSPLDWFNFFDFWHPASIKDAPENRLKQ